MYRVFIVMLIFFKYVNMFENIKSLKVFMKVWQHLLIKKVLGKKPTILDSLGIREENPPC